MIRTTSSALVFVAGLLVGLFATGCGDPAPRPKTRYVTASAVTSQTTSTTAPTGSASSGPVATATAVAPVPQAGPGGLSGPATRALPAPARPITIGQGPVVGTTVRGDVFEHARDWALADLRALDPIDARLSGDGLRDSRELVAFYSRREAGQLFMRVDLLDLRYSAELGGLDVAFLVGWGSGRGAAALPLGLRETTAHPWDLALVVQDTANVALLDASLAPVTTATGALAVSFRSDFDTLEVSLPEAALSARGWAGQDLVFQVLTVKDGEARADDALLEVDLLDRRLDSATRESWVADRRAVLAPVVVGNRAALNASTLTDLCWSTRTRTSEGLPTGLRRTLDSHTAHAQPVTVHLSGQLTAAIGWASSPDPLADGPALLARTAQLWDQDPANGVGAFVPGLFSDNMMPYFEGAPNARFVARAQDAYAAWLGFARPGRVFWIPERVASGATLVEVAALGFTHTVLDRTHLGTWFGAPPTDGRLHRIHGVTSFVVDPTQSLFAQTDGGPDKKLRTLLLERALDRDPHQAIVLVADWEEYAGHKGNPDVPDVYDRTLAWLAQRPWIEVATLEDLAGRAWPVVEHGAPTSPMPVETHEWLRHACEGSYDNWYYGHPLEESLASLRPVVRHGRPFARVLGDVRTPGTLFGDAWARIQAAPAGALRDLAEVSFASALYRTGWHQEDMHDLTRLASGAYLSPDVTFDRLTAFAHALSTHAGESAIVARGAAWAAAPPAQPAVTLEDVDLDGEAEYLLADARLLLVMERDGGRITAGFVRDATTGEGHQVFGDPLAFPEQAAEAGYEQPFVGAARASVLKDVWATGSARDYVNDDSIATVSTTSAAVTFRSSDGLLEKTIAWAAPGRVEVTYRLDPTAGTLYVRAGLSPDLGALALSGQQGLSETDTGAAYTLTKTVGARQVRVEVDYAGPGHSARRNAAVSDGGTASPRTTAYQHLIELSGDAPGFSFGLAVDAR